LYLRAGAVMCAAMKVDCVSTSSLNLPGLWLQINYPSPKPKVARPGGLARNSTLSTSVDPRRICITSGVTEYRVYTEWSVTKLDPSVLSAYGGNLVLISDPATKKRLTKTNPLSQLTDVWEITPNGQ
jgi:hypothetical protein